MKLHLLGRGRRACRLVRWVLWVRGSRCQRQAGRAALQRKVERLRSLSTPFRSMQHGFGVSFHDGDQLTLQLMQTIQDTALCWQSSSSTAGSHHRLATAPLIQLPQLSRESWRCDSNNAIQGDVSPGRPVPRGPSGPSGPVGPGPPGAPAAPGGAGSPGAPAAGAADRNRSHDLTRLKR